MTYIVAARCTEDHGLNDTLFYMIILHFNVELNLLAADGFYFEATSNFQVKGFLDPTIPSYHHLLTISEAQDILQNDLPQMMESNGVHSLSTLLHRANQIRYYCVLETILGSRLLTYYSLNIYSLCSESQILLYCTEKSKPLLGITVR